MRGYIRLARCVNCNEQYTGPIHTACLKATIQPMPRGGKRPGAGRPRIVAKEILFRARQVDLDAIKAHRARTGASLVESLRYACDLLRKHEARKG